MSLYVLGISRLSMRLQDTIGWSMAIHTFAIVGVVLPMRLSLFGVLD